jgi:hypothetical protein
VAQEEYPRPVAPQDAIFNGNSLYVLVRPVPSQAFQSNAIVVAANKAVGDSNICRVARVDPVIIFDAGIANFDIPDRHMSAVAGHDGPPG